MTKAELVARIAEEAGISKKAAGLALESVVKVIHDVLKNGDKIRISDLGTFSVVKRKARKGVNPRTGKPIKIPATTAPKFASAKALKDSVRK
ncbi:MAG: HU family DNA-binding protein [Desulfomonile sp.]|nr:HU family DNA-binding protein [Deltaproteobacteria bacterium]